MLPETEEELIIIVGPEEQAKLPLEACSVCLPPTEPSFSPQDLAEAEPTVVPQSEPVVVSTLIEVEELIEEEEPEQEEAEETAENPFALSGEQPESETSACDEPTLVEEIEADVRDETGRCNDIRTRV